MSKVPVRLSVHAMNAPPAASEIMTGLVWVPVAVQTGRLNPALFVQAACAGDAETGSSRMPRTRRARRGMADLSAGMGKPAHPEWEAMCRGAGSEPAHP